MNTLPLLAKNALKVVQYQWLRMSIWRCFFHGLLPQLVQIWYVCSGAPAPIPIVMAPLFWANTHYFNSQPQHWHVLSPVEELLSTKFTKILHLSNLLNLLQSIASCPLCFQLFLAVLFAANSKYSCLTTQEPRFQSKASDKRWELSLPWIRVWCGFYINLPAPDREWNEVKPN